MNAPAPDRAPTPPSDRDMPRPGPISSQEQRAPVRAAIALAAAGVLLACRAVTAADVPATRPAQPPSPFVFTDVTTNSGLQPHVAGTLNHAIVWTDLDGDDLLDVYLGNFSDRRPPTRSAPGQILRQTAPGRFEPIDAPAVQTVGRTSGGVFADFDNDGDLDLYVGNNTLDPNVGVTRPQGGDGANPTPDGAATTKPAPSAATTPARPPKPKEDESLPHRVARRQPPALYRNDGGTFVDVSAASGAVPPDTFYGRDAAALDYDNDGLLDLLVIEDNVYRRHGRSRLYRNLGGLTFRDVSAEAGLAADLSGFGVAVGDVNGDHLPDFFVGGDNRLYVSDARTRAYREAEHLRATFAHHPTDPDDIVTGVDLGDIDNDGDLDLITGAHFRGSPPRVFLNDGPGDDGRAQFREVTRELGIPPLPNRPATCQVADFDNDGWPDLYWSVWLREPDGSHTPFICRGSGVQDGLPRFDVPSLEGVIVRARRGEGSGGDATTRPRGAGPTTAPITGRRAGYFVNGPAVDYDGDGGLDLLVGSWRSSRLMHNDTPGRGQWLQVKVYGRRVNRMGIGAQVRLYDPGSGRLLGHRELTTAGGYSGSRPPVAHFGLGQHGRVDVAVWLPGRPAPLRLAGVTAGQILTVREP